MESSSCWTPEPFWEVGLWPRHPMRLRLLVVAAAVLAVAVIAVPVASAGWGMPEPLTPRGETVTDIYEKIAIAGIVVFVLVFALLVWILWRFRESTGHGRSTHEAHRGSIKAEMLWTIAPLAVMLWIGVISYAGLVQLDKEIPVEDAEMAVTVIGSQWQWTFDYGGGLVYSPASQVDLDTGEMTFPESFHLPAGIPILMNVTGADVIHAFNIMDANRAYVTMDDANPFGPHQIHQQVHIFPAGTYLIQCKEMCLNPGHAYMRSQLVVEPMPQFQAWLADQSLVSGAPNGLVSKFHVDADATTLRTTGDTTIVKGTRVILDITNKASQPVTVISPGAVRSVTITPGATDLLYFDTAVVGDFTITASNNATLAFSAIEATPVAVDLAAFRLNPEHLDLKAGTTYLFQVKNVHTAQHNLFVGDYGANVLAKSATIGPSGTTSFTWTFEPGTYDMWCDVAGHHGLGMHGTITVA